MDKKEPGSESKLAKVGKKHKSWHKCKKNKKEKRCYEKLGSKSNNVSKERKPKSREVHKPSKDKDVSFGCDKKCYFNKDCSKMVSALRTPYTKVYHCWMMVL